MDRCPLCSTKLRHDEAKVTFLLRFSNVARRRKWAATGYRCWYCGIIPRSEDMTLDHVIPRSRNGDGIKKNLVPCCRKCNEKKGAKSVEEFRILHRQRVVCLPKTHPYRQGESLFAFEVYEWRATK